jgi:hypothetical protein
VAAPLIIPVIPYGKNPPSPHSPEGSSSLGIFQLFPFAEIAMFQFFSLLQTLQECVIK